MWKPYTNHKYFGRFYGVSHRGINKISDLVVLSVGVISGAGNRDSGALITEQPKQGGEQLNGDCSYNDQCSVFSKTAFVQIGPQTCKQVQKRGGSGSGRVSMIFARRAQRARSRIERTRFARRSRCASPKR